MNNFHKIIKQAVSHANKQSEVEQFGDMMRTVQTMLLINIVNRHVDDESLTSELNESAEQVLKQLKTKDADGNEIEGVSELIDLVKVHLKTAIKVIDDI